MLSVAAKSLTRRSSRLSSQSRQGSAGSVQVAGSLPELRRLPGKLPRLCALSVLSVFEMGMLLGGFSNSSRLRGLAAMKLSESTRSSCASLVLTLLVKAFESCSLPCGCGPCPAQRPGQSKGMHLVKLCACLERSIMSSSTCVLWLTKSASISA